MREARLRLTDGATGVQDLDTWVSDYLKRGDCVATIHDAAPLQALCRAQVNQSTCEGLNDLCGDACGRPEGAPLPLMGVRVGEFVGVPAALQCMCTVFGSSRRPGLQAAAAPGSGEPSRPWVSTRGCRGSSSNKEHKRGVQAARNHGGSPPFLESRGLLRCNVRYPPKRSHGTCARSTLRESGSSKADARIRAQPAYSWPHAALLYTRIIHDIGYNQWRSCRQQRAVTNAGRAGV